MIVDKDISAWIILELVFLNLAWMIALSVPMAVLVATLLAFGRLTSDTEILAIKSSGINMLRILIPLLIAAGFLTFGMIEFSDKILPRLNHKGRVLTGDIRTVRPTLTFRPGVFITDIRGYIILIDKIDHQTSEIEGVRITEVKDSDRPKITVASSGLMEFIDRGQTVRLTLRDGEVHMLDSNEPENYRKLDFEEDVIYVGGVGSELQRTESSFKSDREMNIAEMKEVVFNARRAISPFRGRIEQTLDNKFKFLFSDTLDYPFDSTITDSTALTVLKTDMRNLAQKLNRDTNQIKEQKKLVNQYMIEIHKKYSIPAASFAFILIGAPLAILTRRGGMGIAASISLILFTIYWAFLIGGEDLADRGLTTPFLAMWSANLLIGGIGLYLLIKVITEKPLFSFFRK
jgi:lipopolysaccharide export system permease protein